MSLFLSFPGYVSEECHETNKIGATHILNYLSLLFTLIPAGIFAEEPKYL